jgi:hypothetical protein
MELPEEKIVLQDEFSDLDHIKQNKTQSFSRGNIERVMKMAEALGTTQAQVLENAIIAAYVKMFPETKKVSR